MDLILDSCVFIDAFDRDSKKNKEARALLEELLRLGITIAMPAHGWFEVECNLKWLKKNARFNGPAICGRMNYPVELIHIDDKFIKKYSMVDIPYIKAGDHIFIVVAKENNLPLITSDEKMIGVSKKCGIQVYEPAEFLQKIT